MNFGQAETDYAGNCPVPELEAIEAAEWSDGPSGAWVMAQRVAAFVACVLLLPVFAILYPLVRLTSRGPFLFSQERRGYRGKPFKIYKIRTLPASGPKSTVQSVLKNHSDATAVGRVLRELKIDELLQLWNVAKGEMALVGPRPIPVDLDDFLTARIPGFVQRRQVLPGLTGLAQLAARSNTQTVESILEDWSVRHELELESIRNRSFRHDVYVLCKTVGYMIRRVLRVLHLVGPEDGMRVETTGTHRGTLVLGTPIVNASYDQVIEQIKEWVEQKANHYIGVVPVHSLILAKWQGIHRKALEKASINTADGVPVMWAQKLLGHWSATRVAGCALMPKVLERAEAEGWRIAFYGGIPVRLRQLVANTKQQFPKLNIVEAISPPFKPLGGAEDQEMVDRLNAAKPDIVFVGLGCPKQERWMLEHVGRVPAVMIGVGAAFDLHAGAVPPTPNILQRMGLEWVFRLCCQPRRLFMRYATTNPQYAVLILWQLFQRFVLGRNYQVALEWAKTAGPRVEVQLFKHVRRPVASEFGPRITLEGDNAQSDEDVSPSAASQN